MSHERAQRRQAREAEAAVLATRRAAVAEREARAAHRRRRLLGWLPQQRRGARGILAERRRQQLAATLALVVGVNLLAFAFSPDWALRALVLVASLLGAPVAHVMLSRRT